MLKINLKLSTDCLTTDPGPSVMPGLTWVTFHYDVVILAMRDSSLLLLILQNCWKISLHYLTLHQLNIFTATSNKNIT